MLTRIPRFRCLRSSSFPVLLAVWVCAVAAASGADLPKGDPLVAGDPLASFTLRTDAGASGAAEIRIVDSPGPGFRSAWRVETRRDLDSSSAIGLRAPIALPVVEGDIGFIRFFARTLSTADETGSGRINLLVRGISDEPDNVFQLGVSVGREWSEFVFPFRFPRAYAPGTAAVLLGFGFARQTVEVGGLAVLDCGRSLPLETYPRTRFTYAGREAGAPWRAEALARIERIRKGDFTIAVSGKDGRPVAGANVRVEERRSAFQFGSALQFERLVHDSPDNLRYRETVLELFNEASPENDMKWPVWLGEWGGAYSKADALEALRWLRDHHYYVRGHNLVWPSWKNLPKSIGALRGTPRQGEIPALVTQHIREIADETRGLVDEWDVLNEPFTNHDLMDLFGRDIMVGWFREARASMPGIPLYLNDFSNHDMVMDRDHVNDFESTARFLLDRGAPLGGLGIQAHMGAQPNAPVQVLRVLDRYHAALGLPVRITEFDFTTEDEELQADYTRDFLILCFSHPSVVGIQLWGFWEKAHWRPTAAMYRADWSAKPNARVFRDLVLGRWRTRVEGATGADGRFTGRGFFGDYVAVIEARGQRIERPFSFDERTPPLVIGVSLP